MCKGIFLKNLDFVEKRLYTLIFFYSNDFYSNKMRQELTKFQKKHKHYTQLYKIDCEILQNYDIAKKRIKKIPSLLLILNNNTEIILEGFSNTERIEKSIPFGCWSCKHAKYRHKKKIFCKKKNVSMFSHDICRNIEIC